MWSKPWLYTSHYNEIQYFIINHRLKRNIFYRDSYVNNKSLTSHISRLHTKKSCTPFFCISIHDYYSSIYENNDITTFADEMHVLVLMYISQISSSM